MRQPAPTRNVPIREHADLCPFRNEGLPCQCWVSSQYHRGWWHGFAAATMAGVLGNWLILPLILRWFP